MQQRVQRNRLTETRYRVKEKPQHNQTFGLCFPLLCQLASSMVSRRNGYREKGNFPCTTPLHYLAHLMGREMKREAQKIYIFHVHQNYHLRSGGDFKRDREKYNISPQGKKVLKISSHWTLENLNLAFISFPLFVQADDQCI